MHALLYNYYLDTKGEGKGDGIRERQILLR
jgi:hypothetical protein